METMVYITVSSRNVYPPVLDDVYSSLPFSEDDVFSPGNPFTLTTVLIYRVFQNETIFSVSYPFLVHHVLMNNTISASVN